MKYFTAEMWVGLRDDESDKWSKLWAKNFRNYMHQLKKLEPRLNARAFKFFTKESLHDGSLVSFSIRDRDIEAQVLGRRYRKRFYPTDAVMSVIHWEGKYLCELQYSQVRRISVDYSFKAQFFREEPEGLGWWGYDELTSKGKTFLCHEILFDSGATISLEFQSMTVRSRRLQ